MSEQRKTLKPPPGAAWVIPPPPLHVTMAIKGLSAGTATDMQQKAALDWILDGCCLMQDWAFRPEDRHTDIALGRQLVGHAILREIKIQPPRGSENAA